MFLNFINLFVIVKYECVRHTIYNFDFYSFIPKKHENRYNSLNFVFDNNTKKYLKSYPINKIKIWESNQIMTIELLDIITFETKSLLILLKFISQKK